jgi:metal-responsive CopG/Arc/MetJ family transcriptional regulator
MQTPLTLAKPVRLAADIDARTAQRIDRLAAEHQIPRAELIRALVRHALDQHEGA